MWETIGAHFMWAVLCYAIRAVFMDAFSPFLLKQYMCFSLITNYFYFTLQNNYFIETFSLVSETFLK